MHRTPDLVILLSVNEKDRATILGELQNLRLPIINFSSESWEGDQFVISTSNEPQITHFYMELMRFLFLNFQHQSFSNLASMKDSTENDFSKQLHSFISMLAPHLPSSKLPAV